MIIHISSELVEKINKAIDKEKKLFNEFIEKLLITSLKEGKHIISISKRDLSILKKYEFIDEKNKQYLKILDTIRSKVFQNLENLINKIEPSDVIKITYNKFDNVKNEKNNINFRYIPFLEFIDSETLSRTTIVSEHIKNDGTIYEKFFPEVYKEYKKLPFNFYLQKEMGGGNPIHSVLEEKCYKNNVGFHVFIADSDIVSPLNSGKGTTAKTLLNTYKECKNKNNKNIFKFKIYILEVRELENLIPLFFLEDYCNYFYKNYSVLIEKNIEIIKFMDIKKGIYCYEKTKTKKFSIIEIVSQQDVSYLEPSLIMSVDDCDMDKCDNKKKFFCKLLKDSRLDFFYEKKCENLLEKFQENFFYSVEELVDLILKECECKIIKDNWIEIGRIIYSWGVGFGKQHIL